MRSRLPHQRYTPREYAAVLLRKYGNRADRLASDRCDAAMTEPVAVFYERVIDVLPEVRSIGRKAINEGISRLEREEE